MKSTTIPIESASSIIFSSNVSSLLYLINLFFIVEIYLFGIGIKNTINYSNVIPWCGNQQLIKDIKMGENLKFFVLGWPICRRER